MLINIIVWIIVGAIAGWLASIVMKTNAQQGFWADVVVGIIGAFIGGLVLSLLNGGGLDFTANVGLNIGSILTAFIGAIILLAILRVIRRA